MNPKEARKTVLRCDHCGERAKGDKAYDWNASVRLGRVVGHLFPTCQTPEEAAEAVINQATTRYSHNGFGQIVGILAVKVGA